MRDEDEAGALAARLMDLWQDQWAALAADPDLTESWARWLTAMGRLSPGDGDHGAGSASGAASPGPASGPGHADMVRVARRVAALERRVARLAGRRRRRF